MLCFIIASCSNYLVMRFQPLSVKPIDRRIFLFRNLRRSGCLSFQFDEGALLKEPSYQPYWLWAAAFNFQNTPGFIVVNYERHITDFWSAANS